MAAENIEFGTIVADMSRNRVEVGIKVRRLGAQGSAAPTNRVGCAYFVSFGKADV